MLMKCELRTALTEHWAAPLWCPGLISSSLFFFFHVTRLMAVAAGKFWSSSVPAGASAVSWGVGRDLLRSAAGSKAFASVVWQTSEWPDPTSALPSRVGKPRLLLLQTSSSSLLLPGVVIFELCCSCVWKWKLNIWGEDCLSVCLLLLKSNWVLSCSLVFLAFCRSARF